MTDFLQGSVVVENQVVKNGPDRFGVLQHGGYLSDFQFSFLQVAFKDAFFGPSFSQQELDGLFIGALGFQPADFFIKFVFNQSGGNQLF